VAFNVGISLTINSTGGRQIANVTASLNKLDRVAKKTAKSFGVLKSAIGFIAVTALVQLSKSIVKSIGNLQLMFIRLTQVEGSAAKAQKRFDSLFKTFGASPFSIDAVTDSFVRLASAGVELNLAERAISAGADAIAAFGGTSEELKRFSIGLQQVAGKGVLSMEELRQQIGEALPVAMRVFAIETGRSISEVIDLVERGKISAGEFIEELTGGLEKDFGGFKELLGNTVLGSIQGAISTIKKSLLEFSTSNTDAAVRLTVAFQKIGKATAEFIQNITQEDVDRFFETLSNGVDTVLGIGRAFIALGKIVVAVFNTMAKFADPAALGTIGALGIIGFMMFGPAGGIAGIVGGIALIANSTDNLMAKLNQPVDPGAPTFFNKLLNFDITAAGGMDDQFAAAKKKFAEFQKGIAQRGGGGNQSAISGFLGVFKATAEEMAKVEAGLDKLNTKTNKQREAVEGLNKTSVSARRELRAMAKRVEASVQGAATFPFVKTAETSFNRLAAIMEKFEGDQKRLNKLREKPIRTAQEENQLKALASQLGDMADEADALRANIEKVKKIEFDKAFAKARDDAGRVLASFEKIVNEGTKYDAINNKIVEDYRNIEEKLVKQLGIQEALLKVGKGQSDKVRELKDALDKIPGARKRALDIAREQKKVDEKILAINQNINQLEAQKTITDLKRGTRGALEIFTGSTFGDDAADRRLELNTEIERTKARILEIDRQLAGEGLTKAQTEDLVEKKNVLNEIQRAQISAFEQTSAAGLLAQQLWQSVADTITSSVKESIFGLIKGTQTFESVMQKAFDSMLQSSIDFLVELVKIQLQLAVNNALQSSGGSGGGSGGDFFGTAATLAASFFAKNGAAVSGGITPFAKGGIVNGPTMFGMAGEAGTEAILPLTRVGGKLGVESTGGAGGDSFSINISAIDTQSGTEFVRKNAGSIINTMRQANGLNRGIGNVR
jgi:tape measure domain-containing protein